MLSVTQQSVVNKTIDFVKQELKDIESGHDWWHIYRVWKLSVRIAKEESVNMFVVQLGALLHDIADPKFHSGNEEIGPEKARKFLKTLDVDTETIEEVVLIIKNISFKNSFGQSLELTKELQVVQDADRLDALGAIGIARAFNYGGHKNFEIYNPKRKPLKYKSKEDYKKSDSPTINHFYEKLLRLKGMMNTEIGRQLAEGRHQFMEDFLQQFYNEWDGNI